MDGQREKERETGTEAKRKQSFHVNTEAKRLISKVCFNDSVVVEVIFRWIHHFSHKALLSLFLPCGTSAIKLRHQNVRNHCFFPRLFSFHVCTRLLFCHLFTFYLLFICSLFPLIIRSLIDIN